MNRADEAWRGSDSRRSGQRRARILALTASLGLSVSACSLVIDAGREQCVTDGDCARLGEGFDRGGECVEGLCRLIPDPDWSCLVDERPAPPPTATPRRIRVIARMVDLVFRTPVPGIDLSVCERLDADCVQPVARGVSDAEGNVNLMLASGFNGYFRWQSPDTQPVLFFFGAPLSADTVVPLDVVTPQIMAGLDSQFRDITLADRSVLVVYAKNCRGAPGVGVRVSVLEGDQSTNAFYEADGLFPPAQPATTQTGVARVINVPSGNVSVSGTLGDGRSIGIARVLTRPGFATLTILAPQPAQ